MFQRWNTEYTKGNAKHILSTEKERAQESYIIEDNESKQGAQ